MQVAFYRQCGGRLGASTPAGPCGCSLPGAPRPHPLRPATRLTIADAVQTQPAKPAVVVVEAKLKTRKVRRRGGAACRAGGPGGQGGGWRPDAGGEHGFQWPASCGHRLGSVERPPSPSPTPHPSPRRPPPPRPPPSASRSPAAARSWPATPASRCGAGRLEEEEGLEALWALSLWGGEGGQLEARGLGLCGSRGGLSRHPASSDAGGGGRRGAADLAAGLGQRGRGGGGPQPSTRRATKPPREPPRAAWPTPSNTLAPKRQAQRASGSRAPPGPALPPPPPRST